MYAFQLPFRVYPSMEPYDDVALPADRCVSLAYTDPDGSTATCVNSERADATLTLERKGPTQWDIEARWRLDGTAHAELGSRP